MLEEFERIYGEMKLKGSFTVTNFLEEHERSKIFRYNNKIFNHRNARKHINAYISKQNKDEIEYNIRDKRWTFMFYDSELSTDELADHEHKLTFNLHELQ